MGSTQGARRLLAAVGAAFMGGVLVLANPASADIVIEFDRLISGQEGWVRTVEEVPVPANHIGEECEISVVTANQSSVHVGNDLIVTTGTSQVTFVGVEDQANGAVTESYRVVMGSSIKVQLRFGPDELSSMGFSLAFDCDPLTDATVSSTTSAPGLDGGGLTADSTTTTAPAGGAAGCSDGSTGTTTSSVDQTAPASGSTDGCPGLDATATTTTAPTPTTAPASSDAAVTALPSAPPADAVVAAPAYTG